MQMKRWMSGVFAGVLILGLSGAALAWRGGPGMEDAQRGGMMGWGANSGRMGAGGGPCWGRDGAGPARTAIDESKARALATDYAGKHLPGYQVETLSKFDMPRGTMYQVELKGPKGERQVVHINPWGNVRAFGPARNF